MNKLKGLPPIHFISIEESEDRRNNLYQQFEKYGIANFTSHIFKRYEEYDYQLTGKYVPDIGESQKGPLTSHLCFLKEWCKTSSDSYILVLEDDVSLQTVKYWNFTWEDFEKHLPEDWKCVQLSIIKRDSYDDWCFEKRDPFYWSAAAYLIRREYVELLVDSYYKNDIFTLDVKDSRDIPIVENILFAHQDGVYSFPLFVPDLNISSTSKDEDGNPIVFGPDTCAYLSYVSAINWWKSDGKNLTIHQIMNTTLTEEKNVLNDFACDTENGEKNYKLAEWYESQGHTAPAHTYYLRAAERTENNDFAYRALLRASFCYRSQGSRDGTEKILLENALMVLPNRPEAYYFLSLLYEKKSEWQNCYIYSTLGLNCYENDLETISIPEYPGKYGLIFEKAISAWWWGRGNESRNLLKDLYENYWNVMNESHQDLVNLNAEKVGLELKIEKRKIIDCFRFFNEKELLELRYHMYKDLVDKFVLLEGTRTFSGNEWKPLGKQYVNELNLPEDKFIFIETHLPGNDEEVENNEVDKIFTSFSAESTDGHQNALNARTRERMVLDGLMNVLSQFNDDDIFFVSDCDEIIKSEMISHYADAVTQYSHQLVKVPLVELQGRANLRAYFTNTDIPVPTDNVYFVCTKQHFEKNTPTELRYNIHNSFETMYLTKNEKRIEDCGWHFTWMGDANRLKLKQKSTAHYADFIESAKIHDMKSEKVGEFIEQWKPEVNGINPWGNQNFTLKEYSTNFLPKEIFNYKHIQSFLFGDDFKMEIYNKQKNNCDMIIFDREKINQIDVSFIGDYCLDKQEIPGLSGECGRESYKLYTFLSTQFNNSFILDIGSCFGNSAIALSYNPTNQIISYDLQDLGAPTISKENITWKIMDFMNDNIIDYDNVSLILIDVDPHDGKQEPVMIQYLKDIGWSGLLLFDDIHLNPEMEAFWNSFLEEDRYDLTHLGHWSGTGLVKFNL